MHRSTIHIDQFDCTRIKTKVLVIGSGAAGLNAAVQLRERGIEEVTILTDQWGGGTSNNAGSDKQTYYRLDPFHPAGDSVDEMAKSLFSGGCMHGDLAVVEAAGSLPAFYNLVSAGVPFPHDDLNRFPGYQTDHDERGRGSSAGPLTSRFMFEKLAARVVDFQIPILDQRQIVQLLGDLSNGETSVSGCVVINQDIGGDPIKSLELIRADYIILATGGPGELFRESVYPAGQYGASGFALELGAEACNLTEFQFGIASLNPRWNLSGSYQQVVPRYLSIDEEGNQYDFLNTHFTHVEDLTHATFLKGYQWPFDPRKVYDKGSSMIDLLVNQEISVKGRSVWVDFRHNPVDSSGKEVSFDQFHPVVKEYLHKSNATGSNPIARLNELNPPAVHLFRSKGVSLTNEMLPIGVCAQHCNGGISGTTWWESSIGNLFVIGEANGSHGVYRPGGSALNSGQVGGARAAQMIASRINSMSLKVKEFSESSKKSLLKVLRNIQLQSDQTAEWNDEREWEELKRRSSMAMGMIRSQAKVEKALSSLQNQWSRLLGYGFENNRQIGSWFRIKEQLVLQKAILISLKTYLEAGGESRGSYLIEREQGDYEVEGDVGKKFRLDPTDGFTRSHQLIISIDEGEFKTNWIPVRELPESELWFENIWRDFRHNKIVRS